MDIGKLGFGSDTKEVTVSVRNGLWNVSVTRVVYPFGTVVGEADAVPVKVPIKHCRNRWT